MTPTLEIGLVAVACGLACSLAGVFLVLRRMAMLADAISHSILPGLVAGYILVQGPNLLAGAVGAVAAGLLTVLLVEALTKTKKVTNDTAIGLVFPTLFALGVFVVTKFLPNAHLDADAVLFGEIAFAPFDRLTLNGQDLGPQSLWLLGVLALLNALFLKIFFKELKITTFDAALATTLGFAPAVVHLLLMGMVAVTTVGSFSAVGAVLSVAMIVVPPVTASLLTDRLPPLIALSALTGTVAALLGFALAQALDLSISGMMAVALGILFAAALFFAPQRGLVAQSRRRRNQADEFAVHMLVIHLATHRHTPEQHQESTLLHIERELNWPPERLQSIVAKAQKKGYVTLTDGILALTPQGQKLDALLDPS